MVLVFERAPDRSKLARPIRLSILSLPPPRSGSTASDIPPPGTGSQAASCFQSRQRSASRRKFNHSARRGPRGIRAGTPALPLSCPWRTPPRRRTSPDRRPRTDPWPRAPRHESTPSWLGGTRSNSGRKGAETACTCSQTSSALPGQVQGMFLVSSWASNPARSKAAERLPGRAYWKGFCPGAVSGPPDVAVHNPDGASTSRAARRGPRRQNKPARRALTPDRPRAARPRAGT